MKKRISLMAAVLICGFMWTTCDVIKDTVKEPEVTLKSVDFSEIDFDGLTLLSTLDVRNNISVDIPLPQIDWELFVIENPFVDGVIASDGLLASQKTEEVSFPVSFTYINLIETIANLTDENARYKIQMEAHIPVPGLGDFSWPFEHEGKIPIMRPPEIAVASAPGAEITYSNGLIPVPTGATISFALSIKNNSNVAVRVKELSYVLKVGEASLPQGGASDNPTINPGDTETITFDFPVSFSQVTLAVLQSSFSYNLTGNYKFDFPDFPLLEVGDTFSLP